MYVCKNDSVRYKCGAPTEKRIPIPSVNGYRHQWVLDFNIHDTINTSEVDDLLSGEFYFYDDETNNTVHYSDYGAVNLVEIRHGNDLSCTVIIQLAKEVTNSGCKI